MNSDPGSTFSPDGLALWLDAMLAVGVVLGVLLLLVVQVLLSRGRRGPTFERLLRAGSGVLLTRGVMQAGYEALQPLGRFLLARRVSPNTISLVGAGLASLGGLAIAARSFGLAGAGLLMAALCDALDGLVARLGEGGTRAGAVLDAVLDRLAEIVVFAAVAFAFRDSPGYAMVALFALVASLMNSYVSAKAERYEITVPDGSMRRGERSAWVIVGCLSSALLRLTPWSEAAIVPLLVATGAIAVGSSLSVVTRGRALLQALEAADDDERSRSGSSRPRVSLGPRHWFLAGLFLYVLFVTGTDRVRPELILGLLGFVGLFAVARLRPFLDRMVPYALFVVVYDAIRYLRPHFLRAERVATCSVRDLELWLFSVGDGLTPGEWLAARATPATDLLFAAPYFVFVYVVLGYAVFLFFRDRERMSRFLWAFLVANLIGFSTWLLLPVAPPWYVHAHGCTVDLHAPASAAGLARVDAWLGIDYFRSFYAKSTYVFGAMPSLHCCYPMLGLMTAWRHITWRTRPLHIVYVLWMFAASTYLDHHYLVDGLAGFVVAGVAVLVVSFFARSAVTRRTSERPPPSQIAVAGAPF